MQPQLATFTDTATMLQEHKPTHEQTVVVMAPMVFMNEMQTAGQTSKWTEPGNMTHA